MQITRHFHTQIARGVLLVATALLGCVALPAQITSFSISGVVLLNERRPGDQATTIQVELTTERGGEGMRAVVTESGDYKFGGLKPGIYLITARAQGFKSATTRVEISPVGQLRGVTTLDLLPENALPKISHDGQIISSNELRAPRQARVQLEKAQEGLDSGDLSMAEAGIREALRVYPDYANAYCVQGKLRERQGRAAEAREAYARAIAADPDCYAAYLPLLELSRLEGRYSQVREVAAQWKKLQPLVATPYYYAAIALYELGEYDASLEAAEAALRLPHSHLPHLRLVLANCYLKLHNSAAAVVQLEEFLRASPQDPLAVQARRTLEQLRSLQAQ